MTIAKLRNAGIVQLSRTSPTPELDIELLLSHALRCSNEELLIHPEREVLDPFVFLKLVEVRRSGMPIAYLTGHKEFYRRDFFVTKDVLIPRPDTETLIDIALTWIDQNHATRIADIGTGSGCIAVTLACERPQLRIEATDLSSDALAVAERNAAQYHVTNRIAFAYGDGIPALSTIPDLIVSNPPYLSRDWKSDPSIQHEPDLALYASENGMRMIWELIEQSPCPLILEFDPRNANNVSQIAMSNNKTAMIYNDESQRPSVAFISSRQLQNSDQA